MLVSPLRFGNGGKRKDLNSWVNPISLKSSPPLVWFVAEHRSNDAGVRIRPSLINNVQEVIVVAS